MWEIYTLYMIKEDEKVAVSYYTDKSMDRLRRYGEEMSELLGMDYIIVGMSNKEVEEKLNGYKILEEHEYGESLTFYRGKKLCLKK